MHVFEKHSWGVGVSCIIHEMGYVGFLAHKNLQLKDLFLIVSCLTSCDGAHVHRNIGNLVGAVAFSAVVNPALFLALSEFEECDDVVARVSVGDGKGLAGVNCGR